MIDVTCEVWLRNPHNYIREAIEVGHPLYAWDFGMVRKKSLDVHKFCELYVGEQLPWKAMIIRDTYTVLLDHDHDLDNPAAVWPTWEYGQPWQKLLEYIDNPWPDKWWELPAEERPIAGQEHRIIITRLPSLTEGIGKSFIRELSQLQEEHPEVILHIHALYSYKAMFGLNFVSVDWDARTSAAKDRVHLPSGKTVSQPASMQQAHWVNLMGMKPVDLKVPRNRCMFNIRSAIWAGEHYKEAIRFKTRGFTHIDPDNPFKQAPRDKSIMVKRHKSSPGDKWLCNTCNLQIACKFFRDGGVCIVPESEPVELARFFKTRDADTIIDGLGSLLAASANRVNKALETEGVKDELHPETRRMINDLFDRGVKLAKLVNPALAAAGAPRVTQNNLTQINAATPQELMAAITQAFVDKGIPRDQITPDMVLAVIEQPEELRAKAIDVASTEVTS